MQYFGSGNPYFAHRIKVKEFPEGAFEWCEAYDNGGKDFRRFHIEWDEYYVGDAGHKGFTIVQFEWEEAAMMFALTFAIT